DARLGNLIASPQGPVLCDLDTTSIGPPEWDLVPAAVAALRFPDRRDEHRQPPAAHLPRRR
ncbi:MAG: aminoglycoside phosphotransferase, partial [Pseudonocardiaceae bacterium]